MEGYKPQRKSEEELREDRKREDDKRNRTATAVGVAALGVAGALATKELSDHYAQGPDAQPAAATAEAPEEAMKTAGLSSTDAPPPISIPLYESQPQSIGIDGDTQSIELNEEMQEIKLAEQEQRTIDLIQTKSIDSPKR